MAGWGWVVVLGVPDAIAFRVRPNLCRLKKRISLVVFLNRAARVLKPTRVRFHSVMAGAAFATIAGLSAPAAAASIGTSHTAPTTTASSTAAVSHTAPAAATQAGAKAAVKAATVAKPAAPAGPSAND